MNGPHVNIENDQGNYL